MRFGLWGRGCSETLLAARSFVELLAKRCVVATDEPFLTGVVGERERAFIDSVLLEVAETIVNGAYDRLLVLAVRHVHPDDGLCDRLTA